MVKPHDDSDKPFYNFCPTFMKLGENYHLMSAWILAWLANNCGFFYSQVFN